MPEVSQWGPQPFTSRTGRPLTAVTITVYEADGTTPAVLYADQAGVTTVANPLPIGVAAGVAGVDTVGNVIFYAPAGDYVIAVVYNGTEVYRTGISVSADVDAAIALATEVADRIAGDVALGADLATETADRAAGDLALAGDLATEQADRAAGDALAIPLTQKGAALGVATLDAGSKVPTAQLPDIALGDTFTVASQAAMLALAAQRGDVAIRTDLDPDGFFLLVSDSPSTLADWKQILAPGAVISVNGMTGAVTGLALAADLTAEAATARAAEALRLPIEETARYGFMQAAGGRYLHWDDFARSNRLLDGDTAPSGRVYTHGPSFDVEPAIVGGKYRPITTLAAGNVSILYIDHEEDVVAIACQFRYSSDGVTAGENAVMGWCQTGFGNGSIQLGIWRDHWQLFAVYGTVTSPSGKPIGGALVEPYPTLGTGVFADELETGKTYTMIAIWDRVASSMTLVIPTVGRTTITDAKINQLAGNRIGWQMRRPGGANDGDIDFVAIGTSGATAAKQPTAVRTLPAAAYFDGASEAHAVHRISWGNLDWRCMYTPVSWRTGASQCLMSVWDDPTDPYHQCVAYLAVNSAGVPFVGVSIDGISANALVGSCGSAVPFTDGDLDASVGVTYDWQTSTLQFYTTTDGGVTWTAFDAPVVIAGTGNARLLSANSDGITVSSNPLMVGARGKANQLPCTGTMRWADFKFGPSDASRAGKADFSVPWPSGGYIDGQLNTWRITGTLSWRLQNRAVEKVLNLGDLTDTAKAIKNLQVTELIRAVAVSVANRALTGLAAVDGVTPVAGDHVLLAGQTTASENGLWLAAAGAWTRPTDFPAALSFKGRAVLVAGGAEFAGTRWACVMASPWTAKVVGTDDLTWQRTDGLSITHAVAAAGAAVTVNFKDYDIYKITADGSSTPCAITFAKTPGRTAMLLRLKQDGTGGRTWTFTDTIQWANKIAYTPTLTAGATDRVLIIAHADGTFEGDFKKDYGT